MVNLCKSLTKLNKENRVLIVPEIRLPVRGQTIVQSVYYFFIAIILTLRLKKGDRVFLMEYLLPTHNQFIISNIVKYTKPYIKCVGLAHLVPQMLNRHFACDAKLKKWGDSVDCILTFGSSLSKYLINRGIGENKVKTTFHYVDDYYNEDRPSNCKGRIQIIIMGGMQRDFDTLWTIIDNVQDVDFHLCVGNNNNIYSRFLLMKKMNLQLYGYLTEKELRKLMLQCDLSLNVMSDTIGSNVITTSMAMGLGMIVSDVGSIRDYCDESNAFFCKNSEDFIICLNNISKNPSILNDIKYHAMLKAKRFSINKFHNYIRDL